MSLLLCTVHIALKLIYELNLKKIVNPEIRQVAPLTTLTTETNLGILCNSLCTLWYKKWVNTQNLGATPSIELHVIMHIGLPIDKVKV